MTAGISAAVFGTLDNGSEVKLYRLRNARGTVATFCSLGASWVGFQRTSDSTSLVLGCETLEAFASQRAYLGATVGRYANRIGHGQAFINEQKVQLDVNLDPHHLHGGFEGFSAKVWDSHIQLSDTQTPTLTFKYTSPDGEAGYPGTLHVTVVITLGEDDSVRFEYHATTDKPTVVNLTNHTYFNLNGSQAGSLINHEFKLHSHEFLDADSSALPNGDIVNASDTGLDFSTWQSAYKRLNPIEDERIQRAAGFDHCFCYPQDGQLRMVAEARSQQTSTLLQCLTTLPGMQFYSGNFLGGTPINDTDRYESHGAFCFEPGYWPDSPNHAHFPNCVVDESNPYSAIIEYSFTSAD